MGIKFLGGIAAGVAPTALQLPGERELAFNTTDGKLYTNIGGIITTVSSDNGVIWSTGKGYKAGDIISDPVTNTLYVCTTPHTATADVAADIANWKSVSSDTTNVNHDITETYNPGDIVIVGDELYVAPVTPAVPVGAFNPADWTAVSSKDIGGRAYDAAASLSGAIVYLQGDVVTEAGVTYSKTTTTLEVIPGTFDITEWTRVGVEIAGRAFSENESYAIGDVVTEAGLAYRCTTATAGTAVAADPFLAANWQNIDNDVSSTVPLPADLLLAVTRKQGDVVQVVSTGETYKAKASTTLATTLADWLLLGAPEKGGVAWAAGTTYAAGDTISEASNLWIAKAGHTSTAGAASPGTDSPSQVDATSWDLVSTDEKGGVAYIAGLDTPYVQGDLVTNGGVTYRMITAVESTPGTFTGADWQDIETERGGVLFDTSHLYVVGDIVSESDEAWICIQTMTLTDDTQNPGVDPLFWQRVGNDDEVGGVLFSDAKSYALGDVVTYGTTPDELLYRCISVPVTNPGTWTATDWTLIEVAEVAGRLYDPTNGIYAVGDIVTYDDGDSTKSYRCTKSVPAPEAWVTNSWKLENITGSLWDATYAYMKGDIVTDGGAPAIVYVCNIDGVTGGVLTDVINWQELGSIYYNATDGGTIGDATLGDITEAVTPNPSAGGVEHYPYGLAGGLFPDTVGETVGARWIIAGLGWDVNGDKISTPLDGTPGVVDGDIISWTAGVTGSETWLWTPSPRVDGVRTGMAWRSGESYIAGDIVSDSVDGNIYLALIPVDGTPPSAGTVGQWEVQEGGAEVGGIAWGLGTTYVIGDTVTEAGGLYTCTNPHTALTGDVADGSPTQPAQANWTYAQSKPEVGGLGYDGTTVSYDLGTVVGFDSVGDGTGAPGGAPDKGSVLYVANQAAALPGTLSHWTLLETQPEVGGVGYDGTTASFALGTVVGFGTGVAAPGGGTEAAGEVLYVANQAAALPGTLAHWTLLETKPEVGGITWVTGTDYAVGDLVYDATGNSGVSPNDGIGTYVCTATDAASATVPSLNANWSTQINVDPGTY